MGPLTEVSPESNGSSGPSPIVPKVVLNPGRPVYDDGMVFAGSSYETRALLAIRLDGARGDVTGTGQVAWSRNERTPYVPSPLLYDGALYFLYHYQGVLSRLAAKSVAMSLIDTIQLFSWRMARAVVWRWSAGAVV